MPAAAQSVRGRTVEVGTGRAIEGAQVALVADDGGTVAEAITGREGTFQLLARQSGEYRIRASHLAFLTVTSQLFRIEPGEEVVVDVALPTTPIPLEPLTITARRVDPRLGPAIEGFYARQKMAGEGLGFGRVVRRIDPEMLNASNARDVLLWLEPPNRGGIITQAGCLVVYWDGRLVLSQDIADQWLDTPASFFEGVEYYRNPADAPASFREIPLYLADRVFCSVVALWPKTGYFGELPVDLSPPQERANAALYLYDLSGKMAPGIGVGLEVAGHVPVHRNVALGVYLRRTSHHVSADVVDGTMEVLEDPAFLLDQGRRPIALWVLGSEARLTLREAERVRPVVAGRFQVARRALTLVSNRFGNPEDRLSSLGWGVGVTVGVEARFAERIAVQLAVGHDRLRFDPYQELERPWYTTGATWGGTSLRFGVGYALGR